PKLRAEDIRLGYEAGDFGDLVTLESGPVTVITRLHNGGEFVKYRDHLPTDSEVTVLVDRAELLTQTQRAAAVLSAKGEKAQPVTLTVDTDTVSVTPTWETRPPKHARAPCPPRSPATVREWCSHSTTGSSPTLWTASPVTPSPCTSRVRTSRCCSPTPPMVCAT